MSMYVCMYVCNKEMNKDIYISSDSLHDASVRFGYHDRMYAVCK